MSLFILTPDNSYIVYTVFFLETVQTVLNGADLFYWFAAGYGDLTHLTSPFASSYDVPTIEAIVSVIVQFFYAYRVWVLSNKRAWWFCVLICLVGRSKAFLKPLSMDFFLAVLHSQFNSRICWRYLC